MNYSFPECREVVILAPHPDDEALGCSGTIALLNGRGVSSTVIFLSDGERLNGEPSQAVAEQRREEALRASEMIGCRKPIFLGLPDGEVERHIEEGSRKLKDILSLKKPDIVLSPSPIDYHQDHLAAAHIALKLLEDPGNFTLAFYEVYSTMKFTHLIDITEVVGKKEEAILNYSTSFYGKPDIYAHASLGLNAHRALFVREKGYYEAFYITEKADTIDALIDHLCYRD